MICMPCSILLLVLLAYRVFPEHTEAQALYYAYNHSALFKSVPDPNNPSPPLFVPSFHSFTHLLNSLNPGFPASPISWNAKLSEVETCAPRVRSRVRAMGTSKALQDETASAGIYTVGGGERDSRERAV